MPLSLPLTPAAHDETWHAVTLHEAATGSKGDYLQPALRGDRLSGDHSVPLSPTNLPDGGLSFHSEVLKIELRLEHGQLGLYDPKTGKKLLTYEEAQDALQAEQGARRAAEAEAARLREELARLKGSG